MQERAEEEVLVGRGPERAGSGGSQIKAQASSRARPTPFSLSWVFERQGSEKEDPLLMTPVSPFSFPKRRRESVPVTEDLLGQPLSSRDGKPKRWHCERCFREPEGRAAATEPCPREQVVGRGYWQRCPLLAPG